MHEAHDHLPTVGVSGDEYLCDAIVLIQVGDQFDEETDIINSQVSGLLIQTDAGIIEMLFHPIGIHHKATPGGQIIKGEVGEFPGDGAGLLGSVEEDEHLSRWFLRLDDGEGTFPALVLQRSPDHDNSMHGSMLVGETRHHNPGG